MICIQFAMVGEATPLLKALAATPLPRDPNYGFEFHQAPDLIVGIAGEHPRFGVDTIGSVAATLLSHTLIERFAPRLFVNAGTAGGFESKGGAIGDVYVGDDVTVFHDRRIPLGNFEALGRGHFPIRCDRALASELGLKVGIVSSGDSLDCTPEDAKQLAALGASVKEMEAAAIAFVCERRAVPLMLIKAITDLVDHPLSAATQFTQNYALAVGRLTDALLRVLPRL